MEDPVIINNIDRVDHLHSLIRQDLRDVGIKLPKSKKLKKLNQSRSASVSQDDVFNNKVFGEPLCQVPATFIPQYGYVPQFLIDAAELVEKHIESEGIFRKSGSVGRQKELKISVDDGKPFAGANIHDVTALVKQFFRELPEPLLITVYHDALIKCYQLPADKDPKKALLQVCLLLPIENIGALRFTLHMLSKVAAKSDKNRMTANNLALVLAPNLMHSNKGTQKMSSGEEKLLHIHTCIIELLIRHWELVGIVDSSLKHQLNLMSECFGTDDDLDASDDNTLEDSKDVSRKKKRKRSGSLTGFVNSIAQGFAKLRRSTDGKGINMSSNSTYRGELSLASDTSACQSQDILHTSATPCVMRKRRASGDAVPFSASKKQAILGHLPQKSALASTPFTPASTIKKRQHLHDDSCCVDTAKTPSLNATAPALTSKAARKKLNLFGTPGSNKKIKRQNSLVIRKESPAPRSKSSKGKGLFRRLSGNRGDKDCQDSSALSSCTDQIGERLATSLNPSPKSTRSDSALQDHEKQLLRSSSSPTLQNPEYSVMAIDDHMSLNKGFIDDADILGDGHHTVSLRDSRGRSSDRRDSDGARYPGRSKSVDSPGLRRGQPNTVCNGLPRGEAKQLPKSRGRLDKSDISAPSPVIIPVVSDAMDLRGDSELRRSRRDEFEIEKHHQSAHKEFDRKHARKDFDAQSKTPGKHTHQEHKKHESSRHKSVYNLDKSISSQLDTSLMEAVLPPPHGFGDVTIMEQSHPAVTRVEKEDEDIEVDVESDTESEAGFSTISGGTVMQRTDSGHYLKHNHHHSTSGSSLVSSVSYDSVMKPPKPGTSSLQASVSVDSLLSVESHQSQASSASVSTLGRSVSSDSGRCSLIDDVAEDNHVPKHELHGEYIKLSAKATHRKHPVEGDYVVLRHKTHDHKQDINCAVTGDASSSTKLDSRSKSEESNLNITIGSHQDELDNMPRHTDVHRKRSISADDLQNGTKISLPVRPHSIHMSPCKKFNYKPHLEITRETHNLLARAGYIPFTDTPTTSSDVQVPVRSPKRSSYREEMMTTLRSSFHERHSRLNASVRSIRSLPGSVSNCASQGKLNTSNTSASHESDSLSQTNEETTHEDRTHIQDSSETASHPHISELRRKVSEISSSMEKLEKTTKELPEVQNEKQENVNSEHDKKDEPKMETACNSETNGTCNSEDEHQPESGAEFAEPQMSKDSEGSKSEAHHKKVVEFTQPKLFKGMKDIDKSLTLSGFLDKEISQHVQIKRAEMLLPRHDSIVNVQQAGLVAQSVRQFSQRNSGRANKFAMPPVQKRGTSPVRIPTIFAKSDEKVRHYKEIAQFMRERTGAKDFMNLPAVPKTPGKQDNEDEESDLSEGDSMSEGNVTVLEVDSGKKSSFDHASHHKSDSQISAPITKDSQFHSSFKPNNMDPKPSCLSTPSMKSLGLELSESLMETINDVCTPKSQKYLMTSNLDKESVKSPLLESTNTAPCSLLSGLSSSQLADSVKVRPTQGQLPHHSSRQTDQKPGSRLHTPAAGRTHKTHIKRLKNHNSPRKRNQRSPRQRPHSPHHPGVHSPSQFSTEALQLFTPVPIHIDDETSQ